MKWTRQALATLKERYATDGPAKLAEELGTTPFAVTAKARRIGLTSTRKRPPQGFEWTEEMLTALKERYVVEGGDKLAREFGLTLDTVRKKASKLGLHTIAGHASWGKVRAHNNTSSDIHYFDTWHPNMAYILGFLFADGCISKKRTMVSVNVVTKDDAVLQFIRKELRVVSRIRRSIDGPWQPSSSLIISSTVMVERLMALGMMPRKTYNDDPFPEVPDDMMPHFVRGYLDGDGSISINAGGVCTVGFVGSPKFIVGIRDALVRLIGMRTQTVQFKKPKDTEWATVSWSSLEDLRAFRDFAYPSGFGFCLERKRANLEKWLSEDRWPRGSFFGNRFTGSMYQKRREER